MMNLKSKLLLSSAAMMLSAFMVSASLTGCSSGSTNPPPTSSTTDTTKLAFTATQSTTFAQANDMPGSGVQPPFRTFTQTVAQLNAPWLGKSATILTNSYSDGTVDSDYYSQDTAAQKVYKVDLCLEAINSNPTYVGVLGGKVHVGWVLEASMNSPIGTKWEAINQTINTTGAAGSVTLKDTAWMMSDTTFTQASTGTTYTGIKHAHHSFSLSASLGVATAECVIYLSPKLAAPVLYWIHPIASSLGAQNGLQTVLTAHTN